MKQDLLKKINNYIEENNLITPNSTIIIGLSGGPDSVFLLHVLLNIRKEKNLNLIAAHLDHGWRPESADDAQFCKDLCTKHNVPFISKKMDDLNLKIKFNGSKEEIGRKARRHFFETVAKEHNAPAIALAHHSDDQMETFFIRLIRGASLSGLTGMKPQEGLYIRPLLHIKKEEILNYLDAHRIASVIDASNQNDTYLRNRIRNSVIPAIKACDERFEQTFHNTREQLQETEEFLQEQTANVMDRICVGNALKLNQLHALHPVIRKHVLIRWLILHKVTFIPSQGLLDEIIRFLEKSEKDTHSLQQTWQLKKINGMVSIQKSSLS